MGTLVFVCPTTGHEVSTGVEVDRSNYKRSRGRRRRSFVRAVARTIYLRQSGLGWSTRSPKVRTTALLRSLLRRSFASGSKRSTPTRAPYHWRLAKRGQETPTE